jgi:hypothetical protein
MELASVLFAVTKHALGFLESKESRKYVDRLIYLEKKYLAEENKDEKNRDHNAMDGYIWELRIIASATTQLKK